MKKRFFRAPQTSINFVLDVNDIDFVSCIYNGMSYIVENFNDGVIHAVKNSLKNSFSVV